MLSLSDIVARTTPPQPWSDGDNIPWNDPDFSERMLAEHLSQQHDLASRRSSLIDKQVASIRELIAPPPGRVLDLACGPGLYLSRLARLGYSGIGIDFSPASIRYARVDADTHGLELEYRLDDIRTTSPGAEYDAALLLYGQLNLFRRDEARSIIGKAFESLKSGGVLIVEPQTYEHIERSGNDAPSWSSHRAGLFSAEPHLLLTESSWDPIARTSTQRFFVIDANTGSVKRHALSNEAYTTDELDALLSDAGFEQIEHRQSLTGEDMDDGLCVVIGAAPLMP
jgi:SAM-dependent methyltransferase